MKFENTSAKPSFIDGDSCPVDANQRFLFLCYITHKHLEEKFVVCRFICAGFANFWRPFLARDGGIGPLLHFRGKIHGQRPAGFVTSPPS